MKKVRKMPIVMNDNLMKHVFQIRNYLWNSPYISRFNEDGKKAKSKGNHIWNIEAKKTGEGGWTFRPFQRRLAGVPPGVAYVGLRWTWTPRIWDPQASRNNLHVAYTSPSLPPWLSWHEDQYLTGVPTPDAQSCDVTVEARVSPSGVFLQLFADYCFTSSRKMARRSPSLKLCT